MNSGAQQYAMNQNIAPVSRPTMRLSPLLTNTVSNAFDDRAAAATLLQIKRSPSSAHSPLLPSHESSLTQQFFSQPQQSVYITQQPNQHHAHPAHALPLSPTRKRRRTPSPPLLPAAPELHVVMEGEDPVRCICGFDIDDGFTIQCESCHVWQHAACQGIKDQDAAPDIYFCERCDPARRNVDYEHARRVQCERFGVRIQETGTIKKKTRARRQHRRPINAHSASASQPTFGQCTSASSPAESSPSEQYVPILSNIVHPSVRPLLRSFAHAWRGVTALTDDPSEPLSPLTSCDPLPAPSTQEVEEKTFLQPLPVIHPSRPPSYTLRALQPIARRAYVLPYTCAVTPAAEYLREPANQYAQLGVPKQGVHLIPPPLALCLDARTAGGDARWLRSGCHPNAVLRPVVCGSQLARPAPYRPTPPPLSVEDDTEDLDAAITFGVFALRDLKASEEIVLGWEWDDRHVVHELPDLLKKVRNGGETEGVRRAMGQVLAGLCETFRTCACGGDVRGCAVREMERIVSATEQESPQNVAQHRMSHERVHREEDEVSVDMGPLIGVRRGLRTEVVGAAGGREGVRIMEEGLNVGKVASAWEARKRRREVGEAEDEEMLPPRMRKHWIKETVKCLNDGIADQEGREEQLKSPSLEMAGLSLRTRDDSPMITASLSPLPVSPGVTSTPSSHFLSSSPNADVVPPQSVMVATPSRSPDVLRLSLPPNHEPISPSIMRNSPPPLHDHPPPSPITSCRTPMTPLSPYPTTQMNGTFLPLQLVQSSLNEHPSPSPQAPEPPPDSLCPPSYDSKQTAPMEFSRPGPGLPRQSIPRPGISPPPVSQPRPSSPPVSQLHSSPPPAFPSEPTSLTTLPQSAPPSSAKAQPILTRRTLADWKIRKERERRAKEEAAREREVTDIVHVDDKNLETRLPSPTAETKSKEGKGNAWGSDANCDPVVEVKVDGGDTGTPDVSQDRFNPQIDGASKLMHHHHSDRTDKTDAKLPSAPHVHMSQSSHLSPPLNEGDMDIKVDGNPTFQAPLQVAQADQCRVLRSESSLSSISPTVSADPSGFVPRPRVTSPLPRTPPIIREDGNNNRYFFPTTNPPSAVPRSPLTYSHSNPHSPSTRPRSPPTRPRYFRDVSPLSRPQDRDHDRHRDRPLPRAPRELRTRFPQGRPSVVNGDGGSPQQTVSASHYRPEPEGSGGPSHTIGRNRPRPQIPSGENKSDSGWRIRGRVQGGHNGGYDGRRT